jgi:hypothetical protein
LESDMMNLTPPTTWRDYAHKLTAEQIAQLERWDADPEPPRSAPADWSHDRGMIAIAQTYISQLPWWRRWLVS